MGAGVPGSAPDAPLGGPEVAVVPAGPTASPTGVAAPLRGLAGSMNNMITGLARSLAAVQSQKASEG